MLYIVEVAVEAATLAHDLSRMRTWLDHLNSRRLRGRRGRCQWGACPAEV